MQIYLPGGKVIGDNTLYEFKHGKDMIITSEWLDGAILLYERHTLKGFSKNDFFVLELAFSKLEPYWGTIAYYYDGVFQI